MNKASGSDGIPVELFQILKDDAVKVLYSISPRTGKGQFSFQAEKKAMPKNVHTICKIAPISQASKVMLKILQARLLQYLNRELPDVQAGFRKGRGTRDQVANICWIIKQKENSGKKTYFCFID